MKKTISEKLFSQAQKNIPGGVDSPVRAWSAVGENPLFIKRGKGVKLYDEDGNVFIDYVGSWGPLILGHADPRVVKAVSTTAKFGMTFGAPTRLENELAERVKRAIPSIELVRFVCSGTEATMSAIRIARGFTKRDKIIKFIGGYHGHADFLLAKAGSGMTTLGMPDSAGIPKEVAATTLLAPYNNSDVVEKMFNTYKNQIAAVIIEPIAANMGVVPATKTFLKSLRAITKKQNALLIFDEVVTGFRVSLGGAQSLYGLTPDLTCLGKIIGGGLPAAAYGGKREIMEMIAPLGPVYQAGTLSGNPIAMAAGIATIDAILSDKKFYDRLEKLSAKLERGLHEAVVKAEVPITINRVGSMMTLFFTNKPVTDYDSAKNSDTDTYAKFFHKMLEKGIYLPPSQFETFFISAAHTESDIDRTIKSAEKALSAL